MRVSMAVSSGIVSPLDGLTTSQSTHPHAVDITSPEALAIYHAQPRDEILVRPDGYLA
ncbi:hypothetical protein ACWF0M_25760 [Kribbella sp. NPDC055110]